MTGQSRWLLILWLCCLSEGPGYAAPLNDQLMQSELLSIDEPLNDIFDAEKSLDEKSEEPRFQQTKKNVLEEKSLAPKYQRIQNDKESLEEKSLEPQYQRTKRRFGNLAMAASLTVSIAGITFEVYLAIENCCGLHKETCRNEKEFKRLQPILKRKSNQIDEIYLNASNVLEFVKQCNYKNNEIWLELKRVGELSEALITSIDPNLVTRFQNKQNEIKQQIKAKNQTVLSLTYAQLSTEYGNMFQSALGTIMIMSSIWGTGLSSLGSYAYRQYQVNQIKNTLDSKIGQQLRNAKPKAHKLYGLNHQTVDAHLKETAVSHYKSKMSTSKMAKFLTRANQVSMVFAAGFDIYLAIKKIQGCEKIRDDTRRGLAKIREANADLDKLIQNVTDYKTWVDKKGWEFVKGQITGDNVITILQNISRLAEEAGKSAKTRDLMNAKATIDRFISSVAKADYNATYDLQKQLIVALGAVKYVLACRIDQVRLKNYVSAGCKDGHNTLHNLYVKGVKNYPKINSTKCHDESGVPYTSESDIAILVKVDATNQNFQFDCVLNNNRSRDQACQYKYQGYSDADIAREKMTWLKEPQVHFFTKDCPPRNFLFPREKSIVCNLRKQGLNDQAIADSLFLPHLVSKIAAVQCPTEPPPTALPPDDQKTVCKLRALGQSDTQIAKDKGYDLKLTKKVVCPTLTALTQSQKIQVCNFRKLGLSDEAIAGAMGLEKELVAGVVCPTTGTSG